MFDLAFSISRNIQKCLYSEDLKKISVLPLFTASLGGPWYSVQTWHSVNSLTDPLFVIRSDTGLTFGGALGYLKLDSHMSVNGNVSKVALHWHWVFHSVYQMYDLVFNVL